MSIEAMKQALEALDTCHWDYDSEEESYKTFDEDLVNDATEALRQAIEQAEKPKRNAADFLAEKQGAFRDPRVLIMEFYKPEQEPWDTSDMAHRPSGLSVEQEKLCKYCGGIGRVVCDGRCMPKQEPVAWRNAAIRLGEELSSVGCDRYYDLTAEQWLDWALAQDPRGKNSLPAPPKRKQEIFIGTDLTADGMHLVIRRGNEIIHSQFYEAPKRDWVGLTDEEIKDMYNKAINETATVSQFVMFKTFSRAIEAKLKEKNT